MPATIERQVAYKVWLKQIHESEYVKQEGWDPNYIKLGDKQVSRINIVVTVVGRFVADDGNYATLTLDDGTDTIRVKAFGPDVKLIEETKVGAVVRFVGKIKQYQDEKYLAPEIVKVIDNPNWLILHKLELGKIEPRTGDEPAPIAQQKPLPSTPAQPKEVPSEKTLSEPNASDATPEANISSQILALVAELDVESGAPTAGIISKIGDESLAKGKIAELLASGEIYEPKKGFLKLL